jgi:DNA-binding XRE family transcriptional regulator
MAIKARDYMAKLPDREQEAIKAEARKLMLEELSLSAIREARRHSQIELAKKLGIQQPAVSKIERQTDLYLSTLSNYITAVGGELEIVARFPDRDPVRITQFKPLKRAHATIHSEGGGQMKRKGKLSNLDRTANPPDGAVGRTKKGGK